MREVTIGGGEGRARGEGADGGMTGLIAQQGGNGKI